MTIGGVTIYDGTTGAFIDAFGLQGLGVGSDFTFGTDGNLYIAQGSRGAVFRYNGHTFQSLGGFAANVGATSLVFGPDGHLYVAGRINNNVRRFNGQTGRFIDEFVTPASGQLTDPEDLVFGPDGNLYVSSSGTHSVLRYNGQTGQFIDAFVPRRAGGLSNPVGLAFGGPGCFGSPPPPPVEAVPTNPAVAIPCTGSACSVRISCNVAESSGTSCANRIDLFVRAAAARLSGDGLAARAQRRIRFAGGIANVSPAQTAKVKLKLTKKGKEIAKRKRGKKLKGVLEISNTARTAVSSTPIRIRLR